MIDPVRFEHVARIDSTSTELMRRPFGAGPAGPRALMADVQDAGRGRNGRAWVTESPHAVALSVAVEREADGASLLGLPLAAGVVVAEAVAARGARPRLKWPNDVLVDAPAGGLAKAGGILVEIRQQGALQRVVVGVGLNLLPQPALDARRLGQPAGALFEPGAAPEREAFARGLAQALAALVPAFARDGLRPWLARWRALDALADAPVDLLRPDGTREPVVARGIDDDGALRVERPDGTLDRVASGEVGVRRRG
ncbi:MAG: bifunctional biotin--[acetyl-CoA-carboxylase] ligase/biotin operon repressor BirA [Pseudomonadota bacterium]|jgi:BirA family biotin operon repressor/biotin-[acetyl-CoA-carboxylase] ligase